LKPSARQVVQLDRRAALALQQPFHQFAPARLGLVPQLLVEPGAHLGRAAVAGQEARVRD
jgi:hypothetical protein